MSMIAHEAYAVTAPRDSRLSVSGDAQRMRIENGIIAVELRRGDGPLDISFQARNSKGNYQDVCEYFRPDFKKHPEGNKLFDTSVTPYRYQASEMVGDFEILAQSDDKVVVRVTGKTEDAQMEQTISLSRGDAFFHVEVSATLNKPLLDYVMSSLVFKSKERPEFIHSPTAKKTDKRAGPAQDQVIGDHAFHSPAVILQEGPLFAALVPDLDMINKYRVVSPDARRMFVGRRSKFSVPIEADKYTMPTALDLNLVSGLTTHPVLSYGTMDFVVSPHIRYQRSNDASMVRKLHKLRVRYGFPLFLRPDEPANAGYRKIARYLWKRYGHPFFMHERHLAMPFEAYVKTVYGVVSKPMDPKVQAPVPGYY